jgi:hypothetical protein
LQSFFSEAIAPNTFLREVPLTSIREQLCLVGSWQTRIYLVRIPRRRGHSIQSIVRLAQPLLAEITASTVSFELAQTGGISSCRATQIEQPGRIFVLPPSLSRAFPEKSAFC